MTQGLHLAALAQCDDLDFIPLDRELGDFLLFSATWNGCFN